MKQVILISSVLAMMAFTGCGTKPGEAQADGAPSATPINVNGLPQATAPSTSTTQPITAPDVTTPTTTTQPTTTTAAGKNPAHGAPGHRCDIEVGAPLNSPATTATTTPTPTITSNTKPVVQSPVITTTTPTVAPTTTKTAPGMNPAHGQPGHRCDIAVGESLNSKPAPTTTTTSTGPTVPGSTESIKPSIVNTTPVVNSTPVTTTTAPGMNPAHGQPGHRCEIAVGAPLNSKPEPLKNVTTTTDTKTEPKKDN